MKVSIITPFHRGVHFLRDCLQSISEQDFQDYEMILVLDQPEEGYEPLLEEYREKVKIRMIEMPKREHQDKDEESTNELHVTELAMLGGEEAMAEGLLPSGVAAARNAGLAAAEGEFVYFLDSDDYLFRENTLSLLVEKAEETEADLVYGRKAGCWFKREVFIETYQEPESEEAETESEEESNADGELEGQESEAVETGDDQEETEKLDSEEQELREERRRIQAKKKAYKKMMPKLRTASVLHTLIRKNILDQHEIRFQESSEFYADTSFLLETLEQAQIVVREGQAIYVKRKHNDPVHFPAISQVKTARRFDDMIAAYWYTVDRLKAADAVSETATCYSREYLDRKIIQYYVGVFMKQLRRNKKDKWRTTYFESMREIVSQIDKDLYKKMKHFTKKAIRLLIKGDVTKSLNLINRRLALRKVKKVVRNRREIYKYLYRRWFLNTEMKENWVLCESFLGKNYADSPKYIYEYLQQNYPGKYRFIWSINTKSDIPYKHTKVKRFSLRYFYYLGRSKYFILNMRQPVWMEKREDSVFLETWHGTPLKKLVFDMEEVYSASPLYKYEVYRQTRQWDYLIAANKFSSDVFRSCFLFDKEMLEFGYPRNDILYAPDREEKAAAIRKKLGIPENKKTILYAPTWRDDEFYGKGQYKFTLKLDLPKMREALGDEYVILLRTHYFIADSLDVTGVEDFAYNLSKYEDIADIYLISDICITDYSSVFFDYSNLKRPILFYTYDIEKYRDMLRGFYIDMEKELPGPLLFTTEEVIDAVQHIDRIEEQYQERYDEFYERFCGWEDGHASENIAKKVFGLD